MSTPGSEWECVEPPSLEGSSPANDKDPPVCPIGTVPTASPKMSLAKRLRLGMQAIAALVAYVEGLRRVRNASVVH